VLSCSDDDDELPFRPQIVPHINPINFCEVELGGAARIFDLMLANRGQERLLINSFEVHHDRACEFRDAALEGVRLSDDDESDEYAATVRSRASAFMRIPYTPSDETQDEIAITIHSNAENFPEPDGLTIYVCASGKADATEEDPLTCRIRMDPTCSDSTANQYSCNPGPEANLPYTERCPGRCAESGEECWPASFVDEGVPCEDGSVCLAPFYCVADDDNRNEGTCYCRPCSVPPEETWTDCAE